MRETTAVRWRKYGKDRLYVNAPDGVRIGWRDLLTGVDHLVPGAPDEVYHAAVRAWMDDHPDGPRPAPRHISTDSTDAGQEPTQDLGSAATPTGDGLTGSSSAGIEGTAPSLPPGAEDGSRSSPPDQASPASAVADARENSGRTAQATQPPPHIGGNASEDPGDHAEFVAVKPAGVESGGEPDLHGRVDSEENAWEDLAGRRPGASARAEALRLRQERPVRTALARAVGVHTDERAWRIGADGEEKVAARLAKLSKRDPRWRFLHAVPVGEHGSDIDHLVIGPPGVFTLNSKHHPGAKIWIGGDTFMVNGQRHPYVRNSRFEARRAARMLSAAARVPVSAVGVIVPVGAADLRVKKLPTDVVIVNRMRLVRWLKSLPSELSQERIEALYTAARRSTTWQQ